MGIYDVFWGREGGQLTGLGLGLGACIVFVLVFMQFLFYCCWR